MKLDSGRDALILSSPQCHRPFTLFLGVTHDYRAPLELSAVWLMLQRGRFIMIYSILLATRDYNVA